MESKTKTQSHCWWFESYNTSKSSPWLQSTLSELNEKTKTMLKLIEADAESFAQRAEMYYKKRPELISMVEDFYRAHRSLAERYDQLKSDRAVRIRSPLSQSLSLPKEGFDCVFDLVSSKSFDSFTEGAYSSEEGAESEVDDPEAEDNVGQVDEDKVEKEKPFSGGADCDELMKLRDGLGRLREENVTLKNIIRQKDEEKEEFVKRLSENINEIREFREEMGAIREDNLVVGVPLHEVTKLRDEIERLEMENLYQKEQAMEKGRKVVEMTKKFEEVKFGLMKVERELETINRHFNSVVAVKEEEILEVTKQFEATKSELAKLRLEMRRENGKCEDKEVALGHLKERSVVREVENYEPFREILINAPNENNLENKAIKSNNEIGIKDEEINETIRCLRDAVLEKDTEKREAIRRLKEAIIEKDKEKNEIIMQLNNALEEKDEEKREAIRQLSIAMEILREESKRLKKTLVNISPKKKSVSEFQIFKGVNLSKLFSLSSSCEANAI